MVKRTIMAGLVALALAAQTGGVMADVTEVDSAALASMVADGAVVVDVRTPGEWQTTGVVDGSHLLTFFDERGNYDAAAWLASLEEIAPGDQPVILICATGGRTTAISQFLNEKVGRTGVHNATGGISAWIGAGQPVVAPEVPK